MPKVKPGIWAGMVCLLLLGVVSVLLWQHYLARPGQQSLRVIEINGDFVHLNRGLIQQKVADAVANQGFFSVDMSALREAVLALPWVAEVSVQRRWPDTLRIQVTEQTAAAYWNGHALVNRQGELFQPKVLPVFQALPMLQGAPDVAPRMMAFYSRLLTEFAPLGLRITHLQLNARNEWVVQFANQLTLLLGQRAVMQRMQDFSRVYQQLALSHPQRIDMRYEHGFAVRWQPVKGES